MCGDHACWQESQNEPAVKIPTRAGKTGEEVGTGCEGQMKWGVQQQGQGGKIRYRREVGFQA